MKKYNSIKEVLEAVKKGEIDESKLEVYMDNDHTSVHNESSDPIYEGNGYYDIEELWPLLFPKASVNWV